MSARESEYRLSYRDGLAAGKVYVWPGEWSGLFGGRGRSVRGCGRACPAAVAGWMRGFRHGCMDQVQS